MFSVKNKNENGFNKVVLADELQGTFAEVIPDCGALLHAFGLRHEGTLINIIEGYTDKNDFEKNLEAKGFRSAKLSPFVCRLKNGSYSFGEKNYTIEKFYLGENAIHGLLYDAVFEVTDKFADEEKAFVVMKHEYRGKDKGYPFYYDCIVMYKLQKGNALTITTEIINKDAGNIPVADGWHPYFSFGKSINELQLEFQSAAMVEFDEALLPTGKSLTYQKFTSLKKMEDTFFDNCFTVNFAECQPMCVIRDTEKKLQLEIHPGKSYPYLQIYTPPHRQSIAIENLSAAPDAFNNGMGLITLAPGSSANFETTYKITSLT